MIAAKPKYVAAIVVGEGYWMVQNRLSVSWNARHKQPGRVESAAHSSSIPRRTYIHIHPIYSNKFSCCAYWLLIGMECGGSGAPVAGAHIMWYQFCVVVFDSDFVCHKQTSHFSASFYTTWWTSCTMTKYPSEPNSRFHGTPSAAHHSNMFRKYIFICTQDM